jgi:hypothetical protein
LSIEGIVPQLHSSEKPKPSAIAFFAPFGYNPAGRRSWRASAPKATSGWAGIACIQGNQEEMHR